MDDIDEAPAEDEQVRLLVESYKRAGEGVAAAEKEIAAFRNPVQQEATDAKRLSEAQERLKVWQLTLDEVSERLSKRLTESNSGKAN
ncbi:hypothetical protein [Pelagibacterium sp. H642]|uniref:hypothetical protein n=1 Tax=Pelagibacterium sp. H642 TaxID=1881069 RepID=UPI002814FDA0|nr:hypothetical protein [Pelagibacterium sp. H642]WMT92890.1 hypothetical protein NO934_19120 [Pelagibacterium sp. H642]